MDKEATKSPSPDTDGYTQQTSGDNLEGTTNLYMESSDPNTGGQTVTRQGGSRTPEYRLLMGGF